MKTLTKKDILLNKNFYSDEIKKGKIFIYPTDTIYGIGCDATSAESVSRIREIKQRDSSPFSVVVPSKDWIKENCIVEDETPLNKLPGKYTLIFKLKNKSAIAKQQVIGDLNSLGVRIPDNWFSKFLSEINSTFISTSANISGQPSAKSIKELPDSIKEKVDYVIDDGTLNNPPSTIIDLTKDGKVVR